MLELCQSLTEGMNTCAKSLQHGIWTACWRTIADASKWRHGRNLVFTTTSAFMLSILTVTRSRSGSSVESISCVELLYDLFMFNRAHGIRAFRLSTQLPEKQNANEIMRSSTISTHRRGLRAGAPGRDGHRCDMWFGSRRRKMLRE